MDAIQPQYTFTFKRFVIVDRQTTTMEVHDFSESDGMRGLISKNQTQDASQRATRRASRKGIAINPLFPSTEKS